MPDALLPLYGDEKKWIWRAALHRTRSKLKRGVNDSVVQDDFVKLNAIGIAGEVAWARMFAVPWFQNPGKGGDHSRDGDLELRHGVWVEVKTSRNPAKVSVPWTTGSRWSWLAFGHYDPAQSTVALMGVADRELLDRKGEPGEVKDVKGRTVYTRTLASKWLRSSCELVASSVAAPRTAAGRGLHCPWCGNTWPCEESVCLDCLTRREVFLTAGVRRREKRR